MQTFPLLLLSLLLLKQHDPQLATADLRFANSVAELPEFEANNEQSPCLNLHVRKSSHHEGISAGSADPHVSFPFSLLPQLSQGHVW